MAANMGFTLVVNVGIGLFLGKVFDGWLDSSPWGVAFGTAFGMIAGLRSIGRRIVEIEGCQSPPASTADSEQSKQTGKGKQHDTISPPDH